MVLPEVPLIVKVYVPVGVPPPFVDELELLPPAHPATAKAITTANAAPASQRRTAIGWRLNLSAISRNSSANGVIIAGVRQTVNGRDTGGASEVAVVLTLIPTC